MASPGDLTFQAQGAVVLSDGFSVGSGARFTALSEPPPQEIVRTYAYQDVQYFLTQADGPWGTRAWAYDQIGNRLTETADTVSPGYSSAGLLHALVRPGETVAFLYCHGIVQTRP